MHGFEEDLQSIKDWMKRNKVAPTTLGLVALYRTGGVKRLLEGRSTITSLKRVLRHIDKHPEVKNPSRGR